MLKFLMKNAPKIWKVLRPVISWGIKTLGWYATFQAIFGYFKTWGADVTHSVLESPYGIFVIGFLIFIIGMSYLPSPLAKKKTTSAFIFLVCIFAGLFIARNQLEIKKAFTSVNEAVNGKDLTPAEMVRVLNLNPENEQEYVQAINKLVIADRISEAKKLLDNISGRMVTDNGGVLINAIKYQKHDFIKYVLSKKGVQINVKEKTYVRWYNKLQGGAYEYPIDYAISCSDKKATDLIVKEYYKRHLYLDPVTNLKIVKLVGNSPYPLKTPTAQLKLPKLSL